MPIYEYKCEHGHTTDHLHRFSEGDRPSKIPCLACKEDENVVDALFSFAPPAHTMGSIPPAKEIADREPTGLSNHDFKCDSDACGHLFEDINDWSAGQKPSDSRECPKCGGSATTVLGSNIAAWSVKTYGAQGGYFDRGLGVQFTSAKQKERYLKSRNIVQYDDDNESWMERKFSEHDQQVEKEQKELAEYDDRLANHPAFAEFRKAQDQGRM
jgi:hypothetical protein